MEIYELFEVFLIAAFILFQSIFGIGLLVFGTPTYLLLGYSFAESLSILVPVSIMISFYQIYFSRENINNFKTDYFKYCIPSLIISLFITLLFLKNENIKDKYIVYQFDSIGFTPLHHAVKKESVEMCEILLQYKSIINKKD